MMTPHEELVDKVAEAIENKIDAIGDIDSVKLAEAAIDVIIPHLSKALNEAMCGVPAS